MNVAVLPASARAPLDAQLMEAVLTFSDEERPLEPRGRFAPGRSLTRLQLPAGAARFLLEIDAPGSYALFTE